MPTITEDREAIRDLSARYCMYVDMGRVDDWAHLFTEDGVFDLGGGQVLTGRAALKEFCSQLEPGSMHHMTIDHVVEVDHDTATCDASVIVTVKGAIMMVARAHDELRRVDGAWRIAHRSYQPDPS